MRAQEIAVVFEEFFEAGACDVGEFNFGFFGGAGGLTALDDVLLSGAGSLDHLVDGPTFYESRAEVDGAVIDDRCSLE